MYKICMNDVKIRIITVVYDKVLNVLHGNYSTEISRYPVKRESRMICSISR